MNDLTRNNKPNVLALCNISESTAQHGLPCHGHVLASSSSHSEQTATPSTLSMGLACMLSVLGNLLKLKCTWSSCVKLTCEDQRRLTIELGQLEDDNLT